MIFFKEFMTKLVRFELVLIFTKTVETELYNNSYEYLFYKRMIIRMFKIFR
jgi:hypothetical protein